MSADSNLTSGIALVHEAEEALRSVGRKSRAALLLFTPRVIHGPCMPKGTNGGNKRSLIAAGLLARNVRRTSAHTYHVSVHLTPLGEIAQKIEAARVSNESPSS